MDIRRLFLSRKDKNIFILGRTKVLCCLSCVLILGPVFFGAFWLAAKAESNILNVTITVATPPPTCGDGLCNGSETCSNCDDCGACAAPPSGGGGGGGGGIIATPTPSIAPQVIFRGKAYPQSDVTMLKDAQVAAATKAGPDANFEASLSGLAGGTYTFGIWAEDKKGLRSITHTFSIAIAAGATTVVSGIFLPPTISIDKIEVKRGDFLNILGYSAPQAEIAIFVNSDEEIVKKTSAQSDGAWLYKFDTMEVDYGDHTVRSRAAKDGDIATFSKALAFKVGDKTVAAVQPKKTGDVSGDSRVNLIDFSIAAYWYKRPAPPASADFNSDGKVDLKDFSIMAYFWTG